MRRVLVTMATLQKSELGSGCSYRDMGEEILTWFRGLAIGSRKTRSIYSCYRVKMTELDPYERKILRELQRDASLTTAQIAERVGLSASPCWRRIDRLEREGVIQRRVAIVDRHKVGLNAHVFVQVKLNAHGRANLDEFAGKIREFPEVLDCYVLLGSVDFMIRVVAKDISAYEQFFFEELSQLPGVQEITSTVALSEIKATTALPI